MGNDLNETEGMAAICDPKGEAVSRTLTEEECLRMQLATKRERNSHRDLVTAFGSTDIVKTTEEQHYVKSHGAAYRLRGIRARLRLTRVRNGRTDTGTLPVTTEKKMEEE